MTGTSDLDLSNASVYAELFKKDSSNAGRTGNWRSREERRRKELDVLKESERNERLRESAVRFDLGEQTEKIARFEEKLRRMHSSVIYPNHMAAKWRELWERNRRRRKQV